MNNTEILPLFSVLGERMMNGWRIISGRVVSGQATTLSIFCHCSLTVHSLPKY